MSSRRFVQESKSWAYDGSRRRTTIRRSVIRKKTSWRDTSWFRCRRPRLTISWRRRWETRCPPPSCSDGTGIRMRSQTDLPQRARTCSFHPYIRNCTDQANEKSIRSTNRQTTRAGTTRQRVENLNPTRATVAKFYIKIYKKFRLLRT